MNADLLNLQDYPFQRLTVLLNSLEAPDSAKSPIKLSIGEPKHQPPKFVLDSLKSNVGACAVYPKTKGSDALRSSISNWLSKRFSLNQINQDKNVLPVNGTREAIFAFAQAVIDRTKQKPTIISPNPFYQIYEGASILAGAHLHLIPCLASNEYNPNFDDVSDDVWENCQLLYLCSPGNPTGAVLSIEKMKQLIALSDKFNFIIASDECYSEVYMQQPPKGLLEACAQMGRDDYKNCVVFHSLSKRSNLPGLRSGFIAGDENVLASFLQYRTYHGCAMSNMIQKASQAAWDDEEHTIENRKIYTEKFYAVENILNEVCAYNLPSASFYVWLPTAICDVKFTSLLYTQENITVLPGSFLSRTVDDFNPGANHVRIALVATKNECIEAAQRIKTFIIRNGLETKKHLENDRK